MNDLAKNIESLCRQPGRPNQEGIAAAIGIDRTALSRFLSGKRFPTPVQLQKIGAYFKINPADLQLKHEDFLEKIKDSTIDSNIVLASLRSTKRNKIRFPDIFEKYRGCYKIYYYNMKKTAIIVSCLVIEKLEIEGIFINLFNPHIEHDGTASKYIHSGYLYPLTGFMYVFCEQSSAEYEILTLILHDNPAANPGLMKGMVTGVGVAKGVDYIAARPIVAVKIRSNTVTAMEAAKGEIGFFPITNIPERIREYLSDEQVTVPK